MTALTRTLELLAGDPARLSFAKYREGVYSVRFSNLEGDRHFASGAGPTLEDACEQFCAHAQSVGVMPEACPPTERGGDRA